MDANTTKAKRAKSFLPGAIVIAMFAATACSSKPLLTNTSASPEAVARAVLDALRSGDRPRLEGLALGEQEFRDHVWPNLPAARPERNLPFSYVWGDLHQKSQLSLSRTLQAHQARRYELRSVTFAGVTDYGPYRVHRGARFRVSDDADHESDIRVCGSMIEKDGHWKVFSYVVD